MPIRILVADDHAIVRQGLKQIISTTPDMSVDDEAGSHREVLSKVSQKNYDVVVLDLSMPGGSGLDTLKQIRALRPRMPVLVLSFHPEEQYAVRVLKAGGSGYLAKESAPDELVRAIRKVVSGGRYVSSSLAEKLALDLEEDREKPIHETLSDREYQVMCLIAAGKPVGEIAREMSLSAKTVSTYRARVLSKLKMQNNSQLTHYAMKHDLVD